MIKSSLIYLLGGLLNKAIPFLLLPILTRYLTPEEFGTVALFQVFLFFTIPLVGMGLNNNISRNFTKVSRDEMAQLIGTLVGLLCCSTGIIFFLITLWLYLYDQVFEISYRWFLVLPLVAAFHITNQFNLTVLRNQERPVVFAILEVSNSLLNIGISIILIIGLKFGWQGRAIGLVFSTCCFGGIGLLLLHKQNLLVFRFTSSTIKDILHISLPLIPHSLSGVVISLSDRLFLEKLINKEAVGIYVVGYTFGMVVNLFVESFSRAWSPWFYKQMAGCNNTRKRRKKIVRFTYIYFGSILFLAFILTAVSNVVLPFVVTEEYQDSLEFVLWVALGYAFRGMYTMIFPYFVLAGRTNLLAIGTLGTAIINLILNYYLIRMNGTVGAAQATLCSWFILFLFTWVYSSKICPMPWGDLKRA